MRTALALLALASCAASAAPRTWTSADGRTIEAEYLGRAPDGSSLVLARADTAARVTVPLGALSAEDQAHVSTLGTAPAPADPALVAAEKAAEAAAKKKAALEALAKSWPAPMIPENMAGRWSPAHADFVELRRIYDREFSAILSGDVAMNCRTLRTKIERDLKRLQSEAAVDPRTSDMMRKVGAAQLGLSWLSSQVLPHVAKIQAEAAK